MGAPAGRLAGVPYAKPRHEVAEAVATIARGEAGTRDAPSDDATEGVAAFSQRREPRWTAS